MTFNISNLPSRAEYEDWSDQDFQDWLATADSETQSAFAGYFEKPDDYLFLEVLSESHSMSVDFGLANYNVHGSAAHYTDQLLTPQNKPTTTQNILDGLIEGNKTPENLGQTAQEILLQSTAKEIADRIPELFYRDSGFTESLFVEMTTQEPIRSIQILLALLEDEHGTLIAGNLSYRISQEDPNLFISLTDRIEEIDAGAYEKIALAVQIRTQQDDRDYKRSLATGEFQIINTPRANFAEEWLRVERIASHRIDDDNTYIFQTRDIIDYIQAPRNKSLLEWAYSLQSHESPTQARERSFEVAASITRELMLSGPTNFCYTQYQNAASLLDNVAQENYCIAAAILGKMSLIDSGTAVKLLETWADLCQDPGVLRLVAKHSKIIIGDQAFFENLYNHLDPTTQAMIMPMQEVSVHTSEQDLATAQLRNMAGQVSAEETELLKVVDIERSQARLTAYLDVIPNKVREEHRAHETRLQEIFAELASGDAYGQDITRLQEEGQTLMLNYSIESMRSNKFDSMTELRALANSGDYSEDTQKMLRSYIPSMDFCFDYFDQAKDLYQQENFEEAQAMLGLGASSLGVMQQLVEATVFLDLAEQFKDVSPEATVAHQQILAARPQLANAYNQLMRAAQGNSDNQTLEAVLTKSQQVYTTAIGSLKQGPDGVIKSVGWNHILTAKAQSDFAWKAATFTATTALMVALFSVAGPAGAAAGTYLGGAAFGVGTVGASISGAIIGLGVESLLFLSGERIIHSGTVIAEAGLRGRSMTTAMTTARQQMAFQSAGEFGWAYAETFVSLGVLKSFTGASRVAMQRGLIPQNAVGHGIAFASEVMGMSAGGLTVQTLQYGVGHDAYIMRNGEPVKVKCLNDILSAENLGATIQGSFSTAVTYRVGSFLAKPVTQRLTRSIQSSQATRELNIFEKQRASLVEQMKQTTDVGERIGLERKLAAREASLYERLLPHLSGTDKDTVGAAWAKARSIEDVLARAERGLDAVSLRLDPDKAPALLIGEHAFEMTAEPRGDMYVFTRDGKPVAVHKDALQNMASIAQQGMVQGGEIPYYAVETTQGGQPTVRRIVTPEAGRTVIVSGGPKTATMAKAIAQYQNGDISRGNVERAIQDCFDGRATPEVIENLVNAEALTGADVAFIMPRFTRRAQASTSSGENLRSAHNHVTVGVEASSTDRASVTEGQHGLVTGWDMARNVFTFSWFAGEGQRQAAVPAFAQPQTATGGRSRAAERETTEKIPRRTDRHFAQESTPVDSDVARTDYHAALEANRESRQNTIPEVAEIPSLQTFNDVVIFIQRVDAWLERFSDPTQHDAKFIGETGRRIDDLYTNHQLTKYECDQLNELLYQLSLGEDVVLRSHDNRGRYDEIPVDIGPGTLRDIPLTPDSSFDAPATSADVTIPVPSRKAKATPAPEAPRESSHTVESTRNLSELEARVEEQAHDNIESEADINLEATDLYLPNERPQGRGRSVSQTRSELRTRLYDYVDQITALGEGNPDLLEANRELRLSMRELRSDLHEYNDSREEGMAELEAKFDVVEERLDADYLRLAEAEFSPEEKTAPLARATLPYDGLRRAPLRVIEPVPAGAQAVIDGINLSITSDNLQSEVPAQLTNTLASNPRPETEVFEPITKSPELRAFNEEHHGPQERNVSAIGRWTRRRFRFTPFGDQKNAERTQPEGFLSFSQPKIINSPKEPRETNDDGIRIISAGESTRGPRRPQAARRERPVFRTEQRFPAITDPQGLSDYEAGVGFPPLNYRTGGEGVIVDINGRFQETGHGVWIHLGSFGEAQAEYAQTRARWATLPNRKSDAPNPAVRMIAVDRKPRPAQETDNVPEPYSLEFVRGEARNLGEILPADVDWANAVIIDSFAAVAYGNPAREIAGILNSIPRGVDLVVAYGDTRVRLEGGNIVTLDKWLEGIDGLEVVSSNTEQIRGRAFRGTEFWDEWNPEVPLHTRDKYNDRHFLRFTVRRTGDEVVFPELKLAEVLDTGFDVPKPRLFEVVSD